MQSYKAFVLSLLCVLLPFRYITGQTDTEFWFVAPEVSANHGDLPILLNLSTVGEPATVTLSQPANPDFTELSWDLGADEVRQINMSAYLDDLENQPGGQVLNKGILIQSTAPINAYYHVNHPNNLDIYALKGTQALGLEFFIPSQLNFPNIHGQHVFDIVATLDSTVIEILPSKTIVGHGANQVLTITLNRGETYSCRATGQLPFNHLPGSRVIANKAIAVTNTDDSVKPDPNSGWDLLGDQLVPVKNLGTEYIVVKGEANTERIYVTATEDSTVLSFNNLGFWEVTLNAGESHYYVLNDASAFVSSTKPVYVWHLSGFRREPGAALVPPIGCTGVRELRFVRPFSQNFSILLLTERGNEDAFYINDNSQINPTFFRPVPGTENKWVAARISASNANLIANNRLENRKGLFHMGLLIHTGPGSAYGYFSNYNNLTLGDSRNFCEGDSIILDVGEGKTNILWSTGSTEPKLTVKESGTYWVQTEFSGCLLSDTIEVEAISIPADLGPDTVLCSNDSLTLDVSYPEASYVWQDGYNLPVRTFNSTGVYWVDVSRDGCTESDTFDVGIFELPPLELGEDTMICEGEQLRLQASFTGAKYLWQNGNTGGLYIVEDAGEYSVERRLGSCVQKDSINIGISRLEVPVGFDSTLCIGDTIFIDASYSEASYVWEDASTSPQRSFARDGKYLLLVSNNCENELVEWDIQTRDCTCAFSAPNVFTPNGDGMNDRFIPVLNCTPREYELLIVDRWGSKIFSSNNLEDTWDGRFNGGDASEGVYYWMIKFEGAETGNKGPITKNGNLTLFR